MFRCYCFCIKRVPIRRITWDFFNNDTDFVGKPSSFIRYISPFSTTSANQNHQQPSFATVAYLINSCGLSPEGAILASKKINLKTHDNPDSVLLLLRNYGFTGTHIKNLITRHPSLLKVKVENNLKPKLQFLLGLGLPVSDFAELLVLSSDFWLRSSLKNRIIPSIDLLRRLIQTDEKIVKIIKSAGWLLGRDLHKQLVPKVSVLRSQGMLDSDITRMILTCPRVFTQTIDSFSKIIARVNDLGFDSRAPSSFNVAVKALSSLSKSKMEGKMNVFRSLGWTDAEIHFAFQKDPLCMLCSEEKIRKVMHFFVNKLNWESSKLSTYPNLFQYSLESRIIPRCRVIQILTSKNLAPKKLELTSLVAMSEKRFLKEYVTMYQDEVPDLLKTYQGTVGSIEEVPGIMLF